MTALTKRKLADRPWLAQFLMIFLYLVVFLLFVILFQSIGIDPESPVRQFLTGTLSHFLILFIIVPFCLHLSAGKTIFRQYLSDIQLVKTGPILKYLLLVLSCYLILAACQVSASIVWQLMRGFPVTWPFLRQVLDISGDLPPVSAGMLVTIPCIFEEIGSRGVMLQTFRRKYSDRQAVLFSSIGFSVLHLMNLMNPGVEPVWVLGQLVWTIFLGLFYGNLVLKTGALWPAMALHYLGNLFIGSLTGTMQATAPAHIQAIFGMTLTLGFIPNFLMILWTNFFAKRWLSEA